jgi:hypothetical protein
MTADNGFTGFSRLGEDDCLIDNETSDSDSSNDSETTHSSSDSDACDDDLEWDSDDESSLDSNFMAEMAYELGFDIDDDDYDETVATPFGYSAKAMASSQKFIPTVSPMMGFLEKSSSEAPFLRKTYSFSSINTDTPTRSYYPANFKAGGMDEPGCLGQDEPGCQRHFDSDCDDSYTRVSDYVEQNAEVRAWNRTSSHQIKLNPDAALQATECHISSPAGSVVT